MNFPLPLIFKAFPTKNKKAPFRVQKGQTEPKTKSTPETGCAADTTTYERASSEATVQHPANISFVITIASLNLVVAL